MAGFVQMIEIQTSRIEAVRCAAEVLQPRGSRHFRTMSPLMHPRAVKHCSAA